jgi:hypothetical protein
LLIVVARSQHHDAAQAQQKYQKYESNLFHISLLHVSARRHLMRILYCVFKSLSMFLRINGMHPTNESRSKKEKVHIFKKIKLFFKKGLTNENK